MPQPATHLRIPAPCAESWADMTPNGPGRHCAACQKVVVDFTQKTDGEILAYLARAGAAGCGRFRADQLARPLQPAATASRWRSWLASVLALGGVLGSGRAVAQAGGTYFSAGPMPAAASPASGAATFPLPPAAPVLPVAPAPGGAGGPLVVRGKVVGQHDSLGLPGVTVLLQGTTLGTSTDVDGRFELTLPDTAAAGTLAFHYVGYGSQRLPVAAATAAPLVVALADDVQGLMGVVVVGGYNVRRPWPWHPRRLYQWSKYQLARPFRR